VSLERALARHGDTLYRVALLLAPNEAAASRALHTALQRPITPLAGDDLADLLSPLLAALAARARTARPPRPTRAGKPDLARALAALPFAQRRALVLQLLLGFAQAEAAGLSGVTIEELRADTAAGLQGLADATGASLPDEQPTEQCAAVRALIAQAAGPSTADAQVRGHLALCAACRSFEHAWEALAQHTEAGLRARTRNVALPAGVAASLLATRSAPQRFRALLARVGPRRLSLTLLPVGVLLLIAALVLPGFWSDPRAATLSGATPAADPQELVIRALAQRAQPPAGKGVLWHGRWETRWYFPSGSVAPITLEAWLDPTESARHRLQVVHGQGGAPFELEVGDGRRSLFYALSASYYESLYGLAPDFREPQLRHHALDAAGQRVALADRLATGVWAVDEAYLRQALAAPDLRTLGRQREGERVVQLLSYRAASPLGPPTDALRVTGDNRVSVLLALDVEDGRLRSVTELSGEEAGAQSSEVVWRLTDEQWLETETEASAALDATRAWNGRGIFPPEADEGAVDSTLLLADDTRVSSLERLLARPDPQLVVPAAAPPGVERALVLWSMAGRGRVDNGRSPAQIIYLGPGKLFSLSWGAAGPERSPDEELRVKGWEVSIRSRRAQLYQLRGVALVSPAGAQPRNQAASFAISARGFSRAELLDIIEGLGPLDLQRWRAQRGLFQQNGVEPQARAALEAAIDTARPPAPGTLVYRRERSFRRANPQPDPLRDPYHLVRYSSRPPAFRSETWLQGLNEAGSVGQYSEMFNTDDELVQSWLFVPGVRSWAYNAPARQLYLHSADPGQLGWLDWIDPGTLAAIDFLANPGLGVALQPDTRLVVRRQSVSRSNYEQLAIAAMDDGRLPFIADLNASLVVTELALAADSSVRTSRIIVTGYNEGKRIERMVQLWNMEEQRPAELVAAPLALRNGGEPAVSARYVTDGTGEAQASSRFSSITITEAQQLLRTPLFALPAQSSFQLLPIEAWQPMGGERFFNTNEPLLDAAREGRGVWTHYRTDVGLQLSLFQGPAEPLADFLRTHPSTPFWMQSERHRTNVAGQDVEGWLMSNGKQTGYATWWYFAEVDGTLIVAQGAGQWFPSEGLQLMAQLQKVS
jgi:hypothetical protein